MAQSLLDPSFAPVNSHTLTALARLGGFAMAIRSASIRATNADSGSRAFLAARSSANQKTGSRLIEVGCPAIVIERLTGDA